MPIKVRSLYVKSGAKNIGVLIAGLKNGQEMAQGIIEVASSVNPRIYVDPNLFYDYGSPPYGIIPN